MECSRACRKFDYYSMLNGECMCASNFQPEGWLDDIHCDVPCTVEINSACGGASARSVYHKIFDLSPQLEPSVNAFNFLGW